MISNSLQRALRWAGLIIIGLLTAMVMDNAPPAYQIFAYFPPYMGGVHLLGLSIPVIFFLSVNYLLIAAMGYALARPFFEGGAVKSLALKIISSFFIGYVCLAGVIRMISFVCPYHLIYWPVLGAEFLILIVSCWGKGGWFSTPEKKSFALMALFQCLFWILTLIVFLGAVLLLQVAQAEFNWVGHGTHQYAHFLDDWYASGILHFPLISRHYDELIVHYFLGMPIQGTVSTILIWWITLGLNKVSVLVFGWMVFRRLGLSSMYAALAVFFLFLGTSSLCPWRYYLLFDSSNFLFFTVHSGRVTGIGIVIFWIINFLREDTASRPLSILMAILSGLGLTALPETNTLWVLVLLPLLFPFKTDIRPPGPKFIYGALLVMLFLYALPFQPNSWVVVRCVMVLGLIGIAGGWFFVSGLFRSLKFSKVNSTWWGIGALFLSLVLGMVFMGNLFRDNAVSRWTFQRLEPVIGQVERKELSGDLLSRSPFEIGDFSGSTSFKEYSYGVFEFVACYGWILIMILFIPYLYFRLPSGGSLTDQRLYWIFLYIMIIMPFLFFIMDFTNFGANSSWLKSRFQEVPVYFIMLTFFYMLGRAASRIERLVMGLILVIYIITPFLATERPRQILENYKMISKEFCLI